MVDICTFPDTRSLVEQIMREVQEFAEALGATFRHTIEKRINGAQAVGAHKTSMLQDVENGRSLTCGLGRCRGSHGQKHLCVHCFVK